ncbi:MAG: hypothetical protein IKB44_03995 [Clostridia bacterium]|nr:hypothetical protein [Clostridia bacterium]
MFDDIGGKIMKLAMVVAWIGIVCSIIWGLVMMPRAGIIGIIYAGIGALVSWVGSFVLYGFGQLVENSDIIANGRSNSFGRSVSKSNVITYDQLHKNDK